MSATITVRLDDDQERALVKAAEREGKSVSAIVREALDRALAARPISARAGHVRGCLRLPRNTRSMSREIVRKRNWRA